MSGPNPWYAPRARWRRSGQDMGRRVSVAFGTVFLAMIAFAIYQLATDDLSWLNFAGAILMLIGGLGAAYVYFAHAAFNTTRKADGPESSEEYR